MFIKVIIVLASVAIAILAFYLHQYQAAIMVDIAAGLPFASSLIQTIIHSRSEVTPSKANEVNDELITSEQLKRYGSSKTKGKLYLSILGQVFDVTKGKMHYGVGGGYSFFTGRDASRAFVTGDFTETGLSDDVLNLSPQELRALKKWHNFYEKEYKFVGKLIGRFYNNQGHKTPYLIKVEKIIQEAENTERESEAEKLKYPPCNTEWSASKGSRVWCSNKSGGISRDWIGVPRKLFLVGSPTPRCVCVRHPNESHSEESLLNDPRLEEYPGCHEDAISCAVKT
ncbi:neuferricin [Hetaerina americana]|uniref:neuferricin n=1 Tax=Hetaerina americana TaxID=62018 RepID=UPI003A7F1B06